MAKQKMIVDPEFVEGREAEVEIGGETVPFFCGVMPHNANAQEAAGGEARSAPNAVVHQYVYLERNQVTYIGSGWPDDSRRNRSWIVGQYGHARLTLAAFDRGDAAWREVVDHLKRLFSPFNVTITETEPASGPYIKAVITGSRGSRLGCTCGGIAPRSGCSLIPTAIVFTFTPGFQSNRRIAEVSAQEIGHAMGLEHYLVCDDPMSYQQCGPKTFQDKNARCGEDPRYPRNCSCSRTQNSYRHLLNKFGPGGGGGGDGTAGPAVKFLRPPTDAADLPANTRIEIVAEVTDPAGVSTVELIWDFTQKSLRCPGGNNVDWSCSKSGDNYTWKLDVGTGDRTYRIRATNSRGGVTVTPTRLIRLNPVQCYADPVIVLRSPDLDVTYRAGDQLIVEAEVQSGDAESQVREVRFNYHGSNGPETYVMSLADHTKTGEGIWRLNGHLAKRHQAGEFWFSVTATTDKGNSTTTGLFPVVTTSRRTGAKKRSE
jgi:hypothetical protein